MTDAIDLSLPELPIKPRLQPGITWAVDGDAVVIHGGDRPRYFRGRHAGRLLVPVLTAMTGRAGHDELAAAATCTVPVLHKVLRQLDAAGVLEDLAGCQHVPDTSLSDWYARATADTGRHASGRAVVQFLRTQAVHLVGDGPVRKRVADLLEEHGVPVDTSAQGPDRAHALTVVIAPPDFDPQHLTALDDALAAEGARWLLARVDSDDLLLGPLFDRGLFPCLGCAQHALPERAGREGRYESEDARTLWEQQLRTDVQAAAIVAECLALIAGVGSPSTVRQIIRVADVGTEPCVRSVSPAADCPRCVPDGPATLSTESTAAVYEYGVAGLPESLHGGRTQYGHYTPANLMAQVPRRLCLDETGLWSTDLQESGVGEDEAWARLSSLLTEVYGLRPGTLRRYPPTGGNIGSPRALVWLPELLWGPDRSGLHSYEPQLDALCRIEADPDAQDRMRASSAELTCVLQVADIEPLDSKYGPRAPRIAWLDAGVTFEHLALVCASRMLTARHASPERAKDFFGAVPPLSRSVLLSGLVELPDLRAGGA